MLDEFKFLSETESKSTTSYVSKVSDRKKLKEKFGSKAFLDPSELKYPIVDKFGKLDCNLVYAAYIRSREWKEQEISNKAETIYKSHRCSEFTGKDIHEHPTDMYTINFNLLENSLTNHITGNSYAISKIDKNIISGYKSEIKQFTESMSHKSMLAINAISKSAPLAIIEFANKSILTESLIKFISDQKRILNENIIFPLKGNIYMDSEVIYAIDGKIRGSIVNFLESSSYISIKGEFKTSPNNALNNIINALIENVNNNILLGVI
jgi:hypothetical protein